MCFHANKDIGLGLKAETKELQWHKRVHQNSREWCQTPGLVGAP